MNMKFVNKFPLYLYKNNQQCTNSSEVAQKFTQISSRLPVFRKCIKFIIKQARKKNVYFKLNYCDLKLARVEVSMGGWVCCWRNVHWTFLVTDSAWF